MNETALQLSDEHDFMQIRFAGEIFEPILSGALFWPGENTLLVADLHFEKLASFASKGQLLPPYDTRLTLASLKRDIADTGATRVICLGDSFHRDEGVHSLPEDDLAQLKSMVEETEWIWLAGNHDPSPHALGGTCSQSLSIGAVTLAHEPQRGTDGLIAGHLHPAARVMMGGRSVRRPCFAHDGKLLILPAYGAATGSLNIMSQPFHGLWDWEQLQVTMMGRDRVYPVSPKRLVGG